MATRAEGEKNKLTTFTHEVQTQIKTQGPQPKFSKQFCTDEQMTTRGTNRKIFNRHRLLNC